MPGPLLALEYGYQEFTYSLVTQSVGQYSETGELMFTTLEVEGENSNARYIEPEGARSSSEDMHRLGYELGLYHDGGGSSIFELDLQTASGLEFFQTRLAYRYAVTWAIGGVLGIGPTFGLQYRHLASTTKVNADTTVSDEEGDSDRLYLFLDENAEGFTRRYIPTMWSPHIFTTDAGLRLWLQPLPYFHFLAIAYVPRTR